MSTVTYRVPAIHCGHCVHTIKMELSDLEGVQSVQADMNTKQVDVEYADDIARLCNVNGRLLVGTVLLARVLRGDRAYRVAIGCRIQHLQGAGNGPSTGLIGDGDGPPPVLR